MVEDVNIAKAARAPVAASAAATSAISRNPVTKAIEMARRIDIRSAGRTLGGVSAAASFTRSASSAAATSGARLMAPSRRSTSPLNTCSMSTLMRATASRPAARDTALLMPDAVPAWRTSTAFITVVVSGATLTAIPSPSTIIAGRKVLQ